MKDSSRRTILLIEDDAAVAGVLVRHLQRWGHQVIQCANGAEGVAASQEHPGEIDLVLSDMVMPGMTGVEAARIIAHTRPDVPIVFMSGYLQDDAMNDACGIAHCSFIEKPFESRALAALLGNLFGSAVSAPAP